MIGTLILAFVALLGILLRASSPTVNSVYGNLIDNIGVMVAFYYGATGIACAWAYRKVMFNDATFFFTGILLPFLAGVFCFWVGYEVVRKSGLRAAGDRHAAENQERVLRAGTDRLRLHPIDPVGAPPPASR
jgi:hypothetical protein